MKNTRGYGVKRALARALVAVVLVIALFPSANASGAGNQTTNSGSLVAAGMNTACMNFRPVGACIWMTCTIVGCEFDYSIKYAHNIPELVVSSYRNTGQNPWTDVASYSSPTGIAQDGGSNTEGSTTHNVQALLFKNVDIIGSPANLTYNAMSSSGVFCEPAARAYMPYYLSTLDYFWRDATVEAVLAIPNIAQRIGKGGSTFGPLYPRIGFEHQGHDYKSGLVHAKRAAHFTTRNRQPHVYYPAVWSSSTQGQWPPSGGVGNSTLWQQVVPSGDSNCKALPDIDDSRSPNDPYNSRLNQGKGYVWHIWRRYRCCEQEGAVLIAHSGS